MMKTISGNEDKRLKLIH